MQYIQERYLEFALQPLWLTSEVTHNLHKVLKWYCCRALSPIFGEAWFSFLGPVYKEVG